jgi:hypothetical protein
LTGDKLAFIQSLVERKREARQLRLDKPPVTGNCRLLRAASGQATAASRESR